MNENLSGTLNVNISSSFICWIFILLPPFTSILPSIIFLSNKSVNSPFCLSINFCNINLYDFPYLFSGSNKKSDK